MAETVQNFTDYLTALVGTDPLRMEIFEKMNCSTEAFTFNGKTILGLTYTGLDMAVSNYDMREHAVALMNLTDWWDGDPLVQHIGLFDLDYIRTGQPPQIGDTFYNGALPTPGFQVTTGATQYWAPDPTWPTRAPASRRFRFVQMTGTSAYDAINNVEPFRGECLGATMFVYFYAASDTLLRARFETVHANGSLVVGNRNSCVEWNKHCLPIAITDTETIIPGDYAYFTNKADYYLKHRGGDWSGENCVCVGSDVDGNALFSGLGLLNQTEAALRSEMLTYYNVGLPAGDQMSSAAATTICIFNQIRRTVTGE